MFRHFARLPYRHFHLLKRQRQRPWPWPISASVLTVGISTTLVCFSSLALVGRTIKCDGEMEGLDVDVDEEERARRAFPDSFHRPRWRDEEYFTADQILSLGHTWFPLTHSGIARCDGLILNSNPVSEDSITLRFPHHVDGNDRRTYIGLFDGHNGPSTANFLCDHLIDFLSRTLSKLPSQYEYSTFLEMGDSSSFESDLVNNTIKRVFREVDDALLDVKDVLSSPSRENAVRTLRYAYSGSCALVSIYEPDTRVLRVALTGDSRAVLGRKVVDKDGKETYEVHVLSQDQNACNPSEEARLSAEHPGEKVCHNGRVLGWGPSRAFGDAALKWSLDVQKQLYEKYLGDRPRPEVKTPPYFTAEPEISTTLVQRGDFLIMASDGIWDVLTSEEAVGLVGVWLRNNERAVYTKNPRRDMLEVQHRGRDAESSRVYERQGLPVALKDDNTTFYRYWRTEKRFVNKDDNVACHLTRNALGGADSDLTEALLSQVPPRSRRYRDDIGVIVTFFT